MVDKMPLTTLLVGKDKEAVGMLVDQGVDQRSFIFAAQIVSSHPPIDDAEVTSPCHNRNLGKTNTVLVIVEAQRLIVRRLEVEELGAEADQVATAAEVTQLQLKGLQFSYTVGYGLHHGKLSHQPAGTRLAGTAMFAWSIVAQPTGCDKEDHYSV